MSSGLCNVSPVQCVTARAQQLAVPLCVRTLRSLLRNMGVTPTPRPCRLAGGPRMCSAQPCFLCLAFKVGSSFPVETLPSPQQPGPTQPKPRTPSRAERPPPGALGHPCSKSVTHRLGSHPPQSDSGSPDHGRGTAWIVGDMVEPGRLPLRGMSLPFCCLEKHGHVKQVCTLRCTPKGATHAPRLPPAERGLLSQETRVDSFPWGSWRGPPGTWCPSHRFLYLEMRPQASGWLADVPVDNRGVRQQALPPATHTWGLGRLVRGAELPPGRGGNGQFPAGSLSDGAGRSLCGAGSWKLLSPEALE